MQANWNIILNILLLVGVVVAIGRLMMARKQRLGFDRYRPTVGRVDNSPFDSQPLHDDIIAVRKVNAEPALMNTEEEDKQWLQKAVAPKETSPRLMPQDDSQTAPKLSAKMAPRVAPASEPTKMQPKAESRQEKTCTPNSIMMFLLAKENRQFAGYELLQTVLASGLRFGEGHLFHRHQETNGQGPVLCSLAAATATGVFDLQNIGAFSVRGLCIFMNASQDPETDSLRFSVMLETAKQLADGLDAHLLDAERKPLSQDRLNNYYRALGIEHDELEYA